MQEAIKHSPESPELKELARKKLTGLIGSIRHKRKMEEEAKEGQALRPAGQPGTSFTPGHFSSMNRQVVSRQTNGGRIGKENRMAGPHAPPPYYRQ